LDRKIIRRWNW